MRMVVEVAAKVKAKRSDGLAGSAGVLARRMSHTGWRVCFKRGAVVILTRAFLLHGAAGEDARAPQLHEVRIVLLEV